MDDFSTNIRSSALGKLATLAVKSPAVDEESDIARLTEQCERAGQEQPNGLHNGAPRSQTPTARVPMSIRELDVLLALCKASPSVKEEKHASRLVSQLSQYLPESHSQAFRTSPFLHNVKPSPWESLTYNITTALLSLGSGNPSLRDTVFYAVNEYLYSCAEAIDAQNTGTDQHGATQGFTSILSIAVSLVGFLEASALHTSFWAASEKLQIIEHLRSMFTEKLMVSVETASSTVRNASATDPFLRDWRKYARRYAAHGRPLGGILLQEGYMRFVKSCALSLLGSQDLTTDEMFDDYMNGVGIARSHGDAEISLIQCVSQIVHEEMRLLEDGFDYLQLGSSWQQRLTYSVKALALTAFLNCVILAEDIASSDVFVSWLDETLTDPNQMLSIELGTAVLKSTAIIGRMSPNNAASGSRSLMRFIVQGGVSTGPIIAVAARSLAQTLGILSQDAVITTLYSLGNALTTGSSSDRSYQDTPGQATPTTAPLSQPGDPSVVSLSVNGEEESAPHKGIIHAIVTIATSCHDEKISALAQSMLLQKMGKINASVDACLIQETAALAPTTGKAEFQLLLKFYARVHRDGAARGGSNVTEAVRNAMTYLSITLYKSSPLHRTYLLHLLESIVNKGDATELELERRGEVTLSSNDIVLLLKPLALLVSSGDKGTASSLATVSYDEDISSMFRDAWFNFAIHGISINSTVTRDHFKELCLLAKYSPPLVAEGPMEMLESDVELNTVLRRGMGQQHIMEQKKTLTSELPTHEPEIKRLNYPRAVFLNAALLLESLRASSGNCTMFLSYFRDPGLATVEVASCMNGIAEKVVTCYLTKTLSGKHEEFSVPYLSKQLADFFAACCYRIERVQNVAVLSANKIIRELPSALCEKHSLFALLELLTVMWSSCLEEDLDEFEWRPTFTSPRGLVHVDLPDNYSFRRATLEMFHERARAWVATVMDISPLDVKGLLQTYLSESEDDGGYGNVALGRSFALEMGSFIPQSDRRLGSIESYGIDKINVASDFVAQYTTRQKYRYPVISAPDSSGWNFTGEDQQVKSHSPEPPEHVENLLFQLYEQVDAGKSLPIVEVRNALKRAAAVLCTEKDVRPSIVHYFVTLPFRIFSKEAMAIGVSLWLGVINENSRIEPRIMAEVTEAWEETIRRRKGLFNPSFEYVYLFLVWALSPVLTESSYVDPLYAKIELLPTDKELMLKNQQKAQSLISPHSLVLQFFESHFNAVRFGNPQSRRLFSRVIGRTAVGLLETHGHPLAREIHFRIILFGLKVLSHFHAQDQVASWKLKDQILSAALSWFKHPPRWSFGGNRLQLKAEDKILRDVSAALADVALIASQTHGPYKSLQAKQELLQIFIENERSRLKVWLYPLEPERKHFIGPTSGGKNVAEDAASLLWLAWEENPGLAIQLAARLPSSKLRNDIRWLLLNFPEKALNEPESLEIMFGFSLPSDVSTQLKYLLYWAPVNPTEALTYFLPSYGNHPFILQYAMKALESHPIDVRFYFVPQLVQALRYDVLGYVERYILETAKQSQLFAHQVIWNMKANSYKDEDAQVVSANLRNDFVWACLLTLETQQPDPLKPTLDRFMDELISSFSSEEREFYEREFSFFNDITGISGTLRPYIKRSKPEKKEKIEEELRKIKVEVGVYLPSNPDGAVVGIDRKSGKPLQSHAKAPYMATFRIQKTKPRYDPDASGADGSNQKQLTGGADSNPESNQETYDVWQSAIFKVGDDCRQDMLALQMIAAFRSIFSSVGLDVWVFPYRVTSTAPGCGVIDVLPNSISRDMLGREAVNGLYDYFVSKYGGEDSIRFQEARTRFVKSMAAYSLITYLLQFKDRHNGNIMVDDAGHIIHIDFGFCFDIAPGGVRFERAPFKLTSEMIAVMGGTPQAHPNAPGAGSHHNTNSQPYRWFESLVVKGFLASRPHCTKLAHIVTLMLDSGLPCFKPETLKNFRDRFVLDKSERDAAEFMRDLIRKSYMNISTKGYDQFQLLTNGIPY